MTEQTRDHGLGKQKKWDRCSTFLWSRCCIILGGIYFRSNCEFRFYLEKALGEIGINSKNIRVVARNAPYKDVAEFSKCHGFRQNPLSTFITWFFFNQI